VPPKLFLLWAALRFGPSATAVGISIVTFLAIVGVGHGIGLLANTTRRRLLHEPLAFILR